MDIMVGRPVIHPRLPVQTPRPPAVFASFRLGREILTGFRILLRLDGGYDLRGECGVGPEIRVKAGPIPALPCAERDLQPQIDDPDISIIRVCRLVSGEGCVDRLYVVLSEGDDQEYPRARSGPAQGGEPLGDAGLQIACIRLTKCIVCSIIDGNDRRFLPRFPIGTQVALGV